MHLIIICIIATQQIFAEYQEQTINTGLLFAELSKVHTSYTKWHICYYYDLNSYFQQIQQIEICIGKMTKICKTLHDNELCNATIDQLKSHMEDMQQDNTKIESFRQRQERKREHTIRSNGRGLS